MTPFPILSVGSVEITQATQVLSTHLKRSRLIRATQLSRDGLAVHLKLESELPTGSFKVRGALYALWAHLERGTVREVVAASTGNHGAAVAYAAQTFQVRATIYLPRNPNPVKARRISQLGARIVEGGADLTEAFDAAARYAAQSRAYFMQDTTDPDVPFGAGTIAAEILDELPAVDAIYVPVGDTALIRGVAAVAKRLKPQIKIVGVQAANAPAYYLSWQEGEVVQTDTALTIADGLATRRPVAANVTEIRTLVDDMRLVSDDAMLRAMNMLLLEEHLVAEPAGAAALAALSEEADTRSSRQVALIVSGGNVAPDVLRRVASIDRADR